LFFFAYSLRNFRLTFTETDFISNISSVTHNIKCTVTARGCVTICRMFCVKSVAYSPSTEPHELQWMAAVLMCSLENLLHSDQSESAHSQPTLLVLTSLSPPTALIPTLKPITNHNLLLCEYRTWGIYKRRY
jgi:hypothetical protein